MTKYEVQEFTLCDGWINNWYEYDEDNNEIPMIFNSQYDAQLELDAYLSDVNKAFLRGDIETDDNREDFRIVEVLK
jgi:hypothetical protein